MQASRARESATTGGYTTDSSDDEFRYRCQAQLLSLRVKHATKFACEIWRCQTIYGHLKTSTASL